MIQQKFPRGSEWRKWDLHVHTPASFFWVGGKKLKDLSNEIKEGHIESEKDEEIKKFIKAVNESDVAVFCIMDYWTFDWYIELKKYLLRHPGELNKTIFPGMELRVECPVDYRLNIHFILSDKLTEQNLNDFKSELMIRSVNRKLSEEALIASAKMLDASKAAVHGYGDPSVLSDEKLLELGSKTVEITKDSLNAALKNIPPESGYIILPYDTSDGLIDLDWKTHPHDDNYFMQTASIIETRKADNVDLFNCLKTEANKDFFINFSKTIKNTPKPCVSGSDAHEYKNYGKYPSDKITWVKADPTFEGLKQIIYEPVDRVKIQESRPEEKDDYQVIDKINFIDNKFLPDDILINENLTTIIGGKSTGKSVLLRNIAKTIDPEEVKTRLGEVGLSEYEKDVEGFKVTWKDGQENIKNEDKGVRKKIIYIPQSYLNRLVDKKEDKTSIDEIIRNVLQQDDEVSKAFEELKEFERNNEKEISKNVDDLFYSKKDLSEQSELIKNIGDKRGISEQIKRLEAEIKDLKEKAGMTPDQISNYNLLTEKISKIKKEKEVINSDLIYLDALSKTDPFLMIDFEGISLEIKNEISADFDKLKMEFIISWQERINISVGKLNEDLITKELELISATEELSPLLEKARESRALNEKISRLDGEKSKLSTIEKEELKLEKIRQNYFKSLSNMSELHLEFYNKYFDSRAKILKQTVIDGEITFDLNVSFRSLYFQKNINEIFDQRKLSKFTDVNILDYSYSDNINLKQDISKIISGILSEKLVLKSGYSKKDAINKMLQNWFSLDYAIKQNDDDISQMSPGKKSFVLLKLLIELDKSKCPILLDQPEDDLDNRSIYNDLVRFIKDKKKGRQIIIATHNPNLVIGADAEDVIVANQSGEKTPNKTYQFEYVTGSIEDSFENSGETAILYQKGIQEHACDILEGGEDAFKKRKRQYSFN